MEYAQMIPNSVTQEQALKTGFASNKEKPVQ